MTDPKAEALRRYVERLDTAKRGYVSERQSFFDSGGDIAFRAGYDARDEEVAALKAEVERLRSAVRVINKRRCSNGHGTGNWRMACDCCSAHWNAIDAAADRKAP